MRAIVAFSLACILAFGFFMAIPAAQVAAGNRVQCYFTPNEGKVTQGQTMTWKIGAAHTSTGSAQMVMQGVGVIATAPAGSTTMTYLATAPKGIYRIALTMPGCYEMGWLAIR